MWNKYNVTSLQDWSALSSSEQAEQEDQLSATKSQWESIVTYMRAFTGAQKAGLWTTSAIVILSAYHTIQGYRCIKYELREQRVQDFNFDPELYPPFYSTYFLSACLIYTLAGTSFTCLITTAIYMTFYLDSLKQSLWVDYLLPYLLAYFMTYLWNSLFFRDYVYSRVVCEHNNIIYRRVFILLDWFLQCLQVKTR